MECFIKAFIWNGENDVMRTELHFDIWYMCACEGENLIRKSRWLDINNIHRLMSYEVWLESSRNGCSHIPLQTLQRMLYCVLSVIVWVVVHSCAFFGCLIVLN
jgi:hypothetical protein